MKSVVLARLSVPGFEKLTTIVRRSLSRPLALFALATRRCRFAIIGWLRQTVTNTTADNKRVASDPLATEQKAHMLVANFDLGCGRINVLQVSIKQFKKFWVICRKTHCVCADSSNRSQSPVFHSTSSSEHFSSSSSYSSTVEPNHSGNYESKLSTAATTTSDFLDFESLAASAASPDCVLRTSAS